MLRTQSELQLMSLALAYLADLLQASPQSVPGVLLNIPRAPFSPLLRVFVRGWPFDQQYSLSMSHKYPALSHFLGGPGYLTQVPFPDSQTPSSYFFMGFASTRKYIPVFLFIVCCRSLQSIASILSNVYKYQNFVVVYLMFTLCRLFIHQLKFFN